MTLTRDLRRVQALLYSEFGQNDKTLTIERMMVLEFLCRAGASAQVRIGESCGIDRSTLSAIVSSLVNLGYVTRDANENNRRANIIATTRKGRDAFGAVQYKLLNAESAVLASLQPAAQQRFRSMLSALGEPADA